jgi:thiol-disulfide isomerase/thioredoxin
MQGGRVLLNRFPWFTRHSSGIQRGFGVLMVVTSAALFTGADRTFSSWLLTTFPQYGSGLTALENQPAVRDELTKRQGGRTLTPAGSSPAADPLTLGQGAWINSAPLTLDGLKGKVVLVDFWTYSCINCVRTLPYLRAWYDRYHDKGLEIVGVHSPEFAFERSETNLRQAMKDLKVTWPVVQDNGFGIWNAYQNQYWPAHYLYDRSGTLVETHFGEGAYDETEAAIARALGQPLATPSKVSDAVPIAEGPKTPETYLGYGRGERFASPEDVAVDQERAYSVPADLKADHWAYAGPWKILKDGAEGRAGSSLALRFQGQRVYLVIHPVPGKTGSARVTVDGRPVTGGDVRDGVLTPTTDRLYQVVDQPTGTGGLLRVEFDGPVVVYAFTFG